MSWPPISGESGTRGRQSVWKLALSEPVDAHHSTTLSAAHLEFEGGELWGLTLAQQAGSPRQLWGLPP